jgi:hypothetical protein
MRKNGVLPLEIIILSNHEDIAIQRDLDALAKLPESQKLRTLNRPYKVAGRGQTIIDRLDRVIREMRNREHVPEDLTRLVKYRQILIDMGARAFRDL